MKPKKVFLKMVLSALVLTVMTQTAAFAKEASFEGYTYKGTGYTETEWSSNINMIAKIDTYYYQSLSDIEFCAADVYFYKQNSAGQRLDGSVYGYAVAQFEKGGIVYASSERQYDYDNVEAWSEGCSLWIFATPHYYGNALSCN